MRNIHTSVFCLVCIACVCLSGCVTIDQKGVVGVYSGAREVDHGLAWMCVLYADGAFYLTPPEVFDRLPEPKDADYRGHWELSGKTLILKREDGGIERLLVGIRTGCLVLTPDRRDQPVFFWEARELTLR